MNNSLNYGQCRRFSNCPCKDHFKFEIHQIAPISVLIITARIRRMGEGTVFSLSVHTQGGVPGPGPGSGGVPGPHRGGPRSRSRWGVYPVSGLGGSQVQGGGRGVLGQGPRGGGGVSQVQVKVGVTQSQVQWGAPGLSKGKIFDTRFGLIHVQTRKNFFCQGTTPPPQVKGKNFDTRFGFIHVQTGKKFFVEGPPPR